MGQQDPHTYTDLEQGKIANINFDFEVDFNTKTIAAKTRYTFAKPVSGSFFMDLRDLEIRAVLHQDHGVEWEVDQEDKVLGQRLHLKGLEQAEEVTIEYTIKDGASALQWLGKEQTAGGKHPYLFSQCQAIHGRSVFPCQDSPAVRFTYEAVITVPKPLKAVMSAERVEIKEEGDANRCFFKMPQPIPSYLFALAVGNLVDQDLGPRSRIYAEPEVVEAAAWEFAQTEEMIDAAEKLFGPYEWDRFDMLVMPPSFPYGGMENPRLTFLTPTLIVGDRSMASVVAHELAHSWTGNLVTNATWEDFWLNEGWTVYAERRILEALEGTDYANLQGAIRRNSMHNDIQLFGETSDPTRLKYDQTGIDPDDVFSTIPYEKGFAFLNRIESVVGRDKYDPFIQEYIRKFSFKSIGTTEFLDFAKGFFPGIEEQINIQNWIYEPGFPEDAVPIESSMLDDVLAAAKEVEGGKALDAQRAKAWKAEQKILFFQSLPRKVSLDTCKQLEEVMEIPNTKNNSILKEFFVIAINSGYQAVLPGVDNLLSSVGRMLYLKPLYRALKDADWSKDHARVIFEKNKNAYHPIAAGGLATMLK